MSTSSGSRVVTERMAARSVRGTPIRRSMTNTLFKEGGRGAREGGRGKKLYEGMKELYEGEPGEWRGGCQASKGHSHPLQHHPFTFHQHALSTPPFLFEENWR